MLVQENLVPHNLHIYEWLCSLARNKTDGHEITLMALAVIFKPTIDKENGLQHVSYTNIFYVTYIIVSSKY